MSERDARRKILLLKGTLYRLEILQARHTLRGAGSGKVLVGALPGLLKSVWTRHRSALLTTVLPCLLGRGRLGRLARRMLLAAGGVTAFWSWLNRAKDTDDDAPPKA